MDVAWVIMAVYIWKHRRAAVVAFQYNGWLQTMFKKLVSWTWEKVQPAPQVPGQRCTAAVSARLLALSGQNNSLEVWAECMQNNNYQLGEKKLGLIIPVMNNKRK